MNRPVPSRALATALAAAVLAPAVGASQPGPSGTPVDLTHPFDERAVYWPTSEPFRLAVGSAGRTDAGFWYAANSFCAAEHGGTHLDAPYHFAEAGRAADEIPIEDLAGPAVVVDVAEEVAGDADHLVDAAAFRRWEGVHGRLPDRVIVLVRTGWGERWPDPARYLGTAGRGADAVPELRFPGLHPEAAEWLVEERSVRAVGIDTASIDRGRSTDFHAHRILSEADVPIFENVANLDRVPPTGSWVIALPMKIAGGTGGPLRIVAFVPRSGSP